MSLGPMYLEAWAIPLLSTDTRDAKDLLPRSMHVVDVVGLQKKASLDTYIFD